MPRVIGIKERREWNKRWTCGGPLDQHHPLDGTVYITQWLAREWTEQHWRDNEVVSFNLGDKPFLFAHARTLIEAGKKFSDASQDLLADINYRLVKLGGYLEMVTTQVAQGDPEFKKVGDRIPLVEMRNELRNLNHLVQPFGVLALPVFIPARQTWSVQGPKGMVVEVRGFETRDVC